MPKSKGPYLFAEIVHASKNKEREEEENARKLEEYNRQLEAEIEQRRQQRAYENRLRFIKSVVYTICGLLGVGFIFLIMVMCALVK